MSAASAWGSLLCGDNEIITYREKEMGTCTLFPFEPNEQEIRMSSKRNGFGGTDQVFFICPACGDRRRYLYQVGNTFLCRGCARLNYRSQQESRGDMYYYHKGMDFAKNHLVPERIDAFSFTDWIPDRPRYQHQTTYRRFLVRFTKYQAQHADQQMQSLMRIMQRL